jgi:hypothetical protein
MSIRIQPPIAGPAYPRSAPASHTNQGSSFGDHVSRARSVASNIAPASRRTTPAPATNTHATPTLLGDVSRQLLTRVARGERYLEGVVRQGLAGRAYTPADLLAMQAQVYRYTQELELVSKLVERGTSTVKTVLQQNG